MSKRHRDAVAIVNPGASNPAGIINSMLDAVREIMSEVEFKRVGVDAIRHDQALKLMISQLCHVLDMRCELTYTVSDELAAWTKAHDYCKAAAEADTKPIYQCCACHRAMSQAEAEATGGICSDPVCAGQLIDLEVPHGIS